jgi:molecular chaperone HtpG
MLQSNAVLDKIKKSLVKKVLSELKKIMTKDKDLYNKFFDNFKLMLKE